MKAIDYASINTLVRIREQELLGPDVFESLLKARSFDQTVQLLKTTPYGAVTEDFELVLLEKLTETYQFIAEHLPDGSAIPQVFSLLYTYHNLKVLLKTQLAGLALSQLLVPIGAFSEEELLHLVQTETSDSLPKILVEAVQYTCQEYREFERLEAIDILMDRHYFTHVTAVAREIGDDSVLAMVQAWADLYNLTTIYRLRSKPLSQAFFKSILSDEGQLSAKELIGLALSGNSEALLEKLSETSYGGLLPDFNSRDSDVVLALELATDRLSHHYLEGASLEAFGFLPLLALIYYTEMEVKNLRLILTGKRNGFDEAVLRERMRPIYAV